MCRPAMDTVLPVKVLSFPALQGVPREDLARAQQEQQEGEAGAPLAERQSGAEAAQDESAEVEATRKAERDRRAAKAEVCCSSHIGVGTFNLLEGCLAPPMFVVCRLNGTTWYRCSRLTV